MLFRSGGVALLVAEVLVPGVFMMWLGLAGIGTGLVVLALEPGLGWQVAAFGMFAGVSLGGSDLSVDNNANAVLYGRFGVTPADVFYHRGLGMRPEVQALIDDVNARSRPQPVPVTTGAALPQQAVTPFGGAAPTPVQGQPLAVPSEIGRAHV